MIPFLRARLQGLERLYEQCIEQPIKLRLVEWSELSPYHWTHRLKRWLGMQYLKTRHSEVHRDLWGYFILPGCLFLMIALLSAPFWFSSS